MWKITFSDGTSLEGLELSGNTFYSPAEVKRELLTDGKLSHVKIEGPEEDMTGLLGEHGAMKVLSCCYASWCGKWQLVLGDYSDAELRELKREGDIEYVAMMTGVEL